MQVICEECGAIYNIDGEMPKDFTCFCKSIEFKIVKEEPVAQMVH